MTPSLAPPGSIKATAERNAMETCCEACGRPLAERDVDRAEALAKRSALTPRQYEALMYIATYRDTSGCSPTIRMLGALMGVSVPTTYDCILALERKRVIVRDRGARGIRLAGPLRLVR